jgi:hypothetical protein
VSAILAVRLSVEIDGLAPPTRLVGDVSVITGITAFVAGPDVKVAVTDIVSLLTPRNPWVKVIEAEEDPAAIVVVAEDRVNVSC